MSAALTALMFAACSDEQTSFNVENVPGRATIQGTVVYNQGVDLVNGKFVYNYAPVANIPVYVTIQNNSYDKSGNLSGTSVFTTTTDAEGKYSITIPAPATTTTVTVTTADFEGLYTYIDTENGKTVKKEQNVIYKGSVPYETISDHAIRYCDIECTICDKEQNFQGFTEYATLKGKIGKNVEYVENAQPVKDGYGYIVSYNSAKRYNVWEPAASVDLIIKITYDGTMASLAYNATTENNGEFTLQVPVSGFPANDISYTVEVMPYDGTFTHYEEVQKVYYPSSDTQNRNPISYVDYEPQLLKGWYAQQYNVSGTESFPTSTVVRYFEAKTLVFQCTEEELESKQSSYNPYTFNQNNKWLSELLESLND